jgi:hypothetical protein
MIDYTGFNRYTITLSSGLTYYVIAMSELSAKMQLRGIARERSSIVKITAESL